MNAQSPDSQPRWHLDPATREALRLDRVHKLVRADRLEEAMLEAEELLDEVPTHPEALAWLGQCLLDLADPDLAAVTYRTLIRHHPHSHAGYCGLSAAHLAAWDLKQAVATAKHALEIDSECAESHYVLGMAQMLSGTHQPAALVRAHELDPERFPRPMDLTSREWTRLVLEAQSALPADIAKVWQGAEIRLAPLPSSELLKGGESGISPLTPAMYVGEPSDDERPNALVVFTSTLSRCADVEGIVEWLAETMHHEALDWLAGRPG